MTILRHCKVQILKQKRLLHSVYNVTPNTRCQEQQNQACYLTKTVLKNELPPSFINIPSTERENIIEAVKRCIIETNYFHRDAELILPKRWTPHRKAWGMEVFKSGLAIQVLLNMLKIIWSTESSRLVLLYFCFILFLILINCLTCYDIGCNFKLKEV